MAIALWFSPVAAQALVMAVDEFHFHRQRGLSLREWLGHAGDSAGLLACLILPLTVSPSQVSLAIFAGLAVGSCLLVTKDEFLHQRLCSGAEHWCHALLFLLHPLVLLSTGWLWLCRDQPELGLGLQRLLPVPSATAAGSGLLLQAMGVGLFLVYQVLYWVRR